MANLTCPAGTKLISGNVAGYPDLNDEPPFCIDETEATNAQYDSYEAAKSGAKFELIASHGSATSVVARGDDAATLRRQGGQLITNDSTVTGVEVKSVVPSTERTDLLVGYPAFAGPNQPAVFVDWHGAKAYCEAKGGTLPTGDQWEKAARGPQGYDYGTESGTLNHQEAQYWNDSDFVHATVDVKSFPPNGFGVYNMTGNVWEWTLDGYSQYAAKGLRGGSWLNGFPDVLAASLRYNDFPEIRDDDFGFRCAVSPQDSKK